MTDVDRQSAKKRADQNRPEPQRFFALGLPELVEMPCVGAKEISVLVKKSSEPAAVKSTHNKLAYTRSIPAFKYGGLWAVYPSTYRAFQWSQERLAFEAKDQELFVKARFLLSGVRSQLRDLFKSNVDHAALIKLAHASDEVVQTIDAILEIKSP